MVVRETTEGEYCDIGGQVYACADRDIGIQQSVFSCHRVDRVLRYAFQLANGRFAAISPECPGVTGEQYRVAILAAHFVRSPGYFSVIVCSKLFCDILSDLGLALVWGKSVAARANRNPERRYPPRFECVHGSPPYIAEPAIANPVIAIRSGALIHEHLGEIEAARTVEHAIPHSLMRPETRTRDLGGSANTGTTIAILAAL